MSNLTSEVFNFGNTLAAVLEYPHCPSVIREAIHSHLAELYRQTDLTRPDIIRALYDLIAPTPTMAAPETNAAVAETTTSPAEEEPPSTPLDAASTLEQDSLPVESTEATATETTTVASASETLAAEAVAETVSEANTAEVVEAVVEAAAEPPALETATAESASTEPDAEKDAVKEEFAVVGEFGVNGAAQTESLQSHV